jgi:hypothetical protein
LSHDNINSVVGLTREPRTNKWGLVSPYQENGNLKSYLRKNKNAFDEDRKIQMGLQIACGLRWLYGKDEEVEIPYDQQNPFLLYIWI